MKRFLLPLFLLCTLIGVSATPLTPLKAAQHKATYTIVTLGALFGAGCSATAISEHVLLTSAHCREEDGKVYLNQTAKPYRHPLDVSDVFYDGADHMLLVLPGVTFKYFVEYDPAKYRPLGFMDHWYFWGNPAMIMDQYREGYVSGFALPPSNDEIMLSQKITILSGPAVGGDSGSGIFAADDGRLVGTLTWGIEGGLFSGFYPLSFSPEQVDQAEGKGTYEYAVPPVPVKVDVNVTTASSASSDAPSVKRYDFDRIAVLLGILVLYFVLPGIWRIAKIVMKALKNIGNGMLDAIGYICRLAKQIHQFFKQV